MTFRRSAWPWFTGVAGLLILDQVTKVLVRRHLPIHHSIPIIGDDFLRFTRVQNPGIAFGADFVSIGLQLFFGWTAAVLLIYYLYKLARRGDPFRWPVMLFLAGAVGNSIDRSIYGNVTDFVDVDFPDIIMERFAVFNVADSCITIGVVLLFVLVLFVRHKHSENTPSIDDQSPGSQDTLSADDGSGTTTTADR